MLKFTIVIGKNWPLEDAIQQEKIESWNNNVFVVRERLKNALKDSLNILRIENT